MLEDQRDDEDEAEFDEDSYGSSSDYGDEDSSAFMELIPS